MTVPDELPGEREDESGAEPDYTAGKKPAESRRGHDTKDARENTPQSGGEDSRPEHEKRHAVEPEPEGRLVEVGLIGDAAERPQRRRIARSGCLPCLHRNRAVPRGVRRQCALRDAGNTERKCNKRGKDRMKRA